MTDPLSEVAKQAADAETSIEQRNAAIRSAALAGHSLRQIAAAAKLNHETVRRIIKANQ